MGIIGSDPIHNVNRTLIETFVRQKLKEMQEDPDRCTRTLVDMALHFSTGRFQKDFFQAAQTMLENEDSGYYELIQDAAAHMDQEHLLTFGMNVGYNSCTAGAKRIREVEARQGFNVPWTVTLLTDSQRYPAMERAYQSLMEQGKELGIYTWMLCPNGKPEALLPLVESQPDCAFVLFSDAGQMSSSFLNRAAELKNLLLAVKYDDQAEECCRQLRQRQTLYGVYLPYRQAEAEQVVSESTLQDVSVLHPGVTIFMPLEPGERMADYQFVLTARNDQKYCTLPFALWEDIRRVDSIISDEAVVVAFDGEGRLFRSGTTQPCEGLSIREKPLADILAAAFPRRHSQEQTGEQNS
ncbi:MAG: hypothetical protein LUD78_11905 [Clostridiales bacterium]|nr:hypothetical protein [Clostridiales bacterium]